MHYLNVLLSAIISTYFNNTSCLLHIFDDLSNAVQLKEIPVISQYLEGDNNQIFPENHERCVHFLMQCKNTATIFEFIETQLEYYEGTHGVVYRYNGRKYIIIINDEVNLTHFFEMKQLHIVRDVLVIYASNDSIGLQQNPRRLSTLLNYIEEYQNSKQTFQLFTHKYVGIEENSTPIWLDTWHACNLSFQNNQNLYPDKVTDQQGRVLNATCYNNLPFAICDSDPPMGSEHNIIVKYAKRFNFTLSVIISETNAILSNTFNLLLDVDKEWDIIYGGASWPALDYIRSATSTYIALVPLPNVKYGFFTLAEVFNWNVWIPILFLYLITIGVLNIRRKITPEPQITQPQYISQLDLYGLFINQPILLPAVMQNQKFYNYVIMLMLLTCILLTTAFNSRLFSVMTSPVYENNINTLTELAKSDLRLRFLIDGLEETINNDQREVYKLLSDKVIEGQIGDEEVKMLSISRDYAIGLERGLSGIYFERPTFLQSIHGKFKPVTPELYTNYYYIILTANSMQTDEMAKLVMTAEESGLPRFWEDDAMRMLNAQQFYRRMQEYSLPGSDILNINHLNGIFAFWCCGLIASTIILGVECCLKVKHVSKDLSKF